jgi:hypothetical protein
MLEDKGRFSVLFDIKLGLIMSLLLWGGGVELQTEGIICNDETENPNQVDISSQV